MRAPGEVPTTAGRADMAAPDAPDTRSQPTLRTPRLTLRPFGLADAEGVRRLGGDPDVSATALHVPHPMDLEVAASWIASHPGAYAACTLAAFAVVSARDEALLGAVGLTIEPKLARAELGYWLGKAFWGRGYANEAAARVLRFGFEELRLRRIHANHLADNPASGRVLEKLGLTREGCLRQHARHRGAVHDVVMYGIVRRDTAAAYSRLARVDSPLRRSLP